MNAFTFIWLIAGLLSFHDIKPREKGYDLSKPDQTLILPDTLREISGLTKLDAASVACIQDENGIVFIYDLDKNAIQKQLSFHLDGDYEGIARVKTTLYVLRSDGVLFEISDYESENFKMDSIPTGIPVSNNEGLCYDPDNNRLLIGCKAKPGKGPEFKDHRVIYGFDLKTKKLSSEPVFDFDIKKLKKFAEEHEISLPQKTKKQGEVQESVIRFTTSAIAIHPITKKLYLLSSTDPMLFIFDMKGNVEHIELLDAKLFNKAEGIAFFENGDMLVSNEGQSGKATVLRFGYRER